MQRSVRLSTFIHARRVPGQRYQNERQGGRPSYASVRGPTQLVDAIRLSDLVPSESGSVFLQGPTVTTVTSHSYLVRYDAQNSWNQICERIDIGAILNVGGRNVKARTDRIGGRLLLHGT